MVNETDMTKSSPKSKMSGMWKDVLKDDKCVRHKWFACPTNKHMEVWQFHPRAKKFNLEAVSKEINWIGVLEKKIHKTQFEDITK